MGRIEFPINLSVNRAIATTGVLNGRPGAKCETYGENQS